MEQRIKELIRRYKDRILQIEDELNTYNFTERGETEHVTEYETLLNVIEHLQNILIEGEQNNETK